MRVIKPGKPWSSAADCKHCHSQLKVSAESLEFYDARRAAGGVGFTCPVCDAKNEFTIEIPPAVGDQIYRRKGFSIAKPEVVKRGRPRGFKILCGSCEAELLVEIEDLRLVPPDRFRTDCAACLSVIEIPHHLIPNEVKDAMLPKADPDLEDDDTESGRASKPAAEGAGEPPEDAPKTIIVF